MMPPTNRRDAVVRHARNALLPSMSSEQGTNPPSSRPIVRMAGAVAVLGALALAGCRSTPVPGVAASSPPLDGTSWVLSSLATRTPIPGTTLASDRMTGDRMPPATLGFAEGRAFGSDGCNRFNVPYTAKEGALSWSSRPASTQMACPPAAMEQGAAFMAALSGASGYRVTNGNLQLLAADGRVQATFAPQARSLAGTNWRATAINDGRGAVVSLVAESTLTLAFSADGVASGSAGCNRFTSAYTAQGESLRLQAPAATRRMCVSEAIMNQEQAYLRALGTVATARREGDRLELRTADGALAAILDRDPNPQ